MTAHYAIRSARSRDLETIVAFTLEEAREAEGVEHVAVIFDDTSLIGSAGSTSASRQTQMTGGAVHAIEATNASRTMLMDLGSLRWDPEMLDILGLPVERLWFTVYTDDDDAARLWREMGAPADRILRFGDKDNVFFRSPNHAFDLDALNDIDVNLEGLSHLGPNVFGYMTSSPELMKKERESRDLARRVPNAEGSERAELERPKPA